MNSLSLLNNIVASITDIYDRREAQAIAKILIEDILHQSYTKALAGLLPELTKEQTLALNTTIKRLKNNEPIQHIIGHTYFCGLKIKVDKSVLIPRPETEQLVDIATRLFSPNETPTIMDTSTGSGCIAIAMKHSRPKWNIAASDISDSALETAKTNATLNNTEIAFSHFNLLADSLENNLYDLITSNPPYVIKKEISTMKPNVLEHEPHLALFVDDNNPLIFYDALAHHGKTALKANGFLLMEINHLLASETKKLFDNYGYHNTTLFNDCFDIPRFILCQK
ncbi:MAG: peptide chain release factor N(5)-glutamine methyltransferase [Bacteroidaceae bacterium]|nr:peptide chain release factor N(5)-glutamine methyltransferase [Bacteroidaceae bacterium]